MTFPPGERTRIPAQPHRPARTILTMHPSRLPVLGALLSSTLYAQTAPAPSLPKPPASTSSIAREPFAPPPPTPTRAEILRGAYGPYRANNDLLYYHLDLRVDPIAKTIAGHNIVRFRMLQDGTRIQLDLTETLTVERIMLLNQEISSGDIPDVNAVTLNFSRDSGALFIDFPTILKKNKVYEISVAYHGAPIAKGRFGGLSFEKDPAGRPWIFTADEDDGCSIFWPCKDQWRDEPQDGMDLSVAVPHELSAIANGRLISKVPEPGDGAYTRWNWRVTYPINCYGVALNIGAYQHFTDDYHGLSLDFYALPEDLPAAKMQFAQARDMLDAFTHYFGPYPFARDGYKLVQVPYSGMEHQSAVAYGNRFQNGYGPAAPDGTRDWTGAGISPRFDFIIIHESGHEWFGNSVTAADPADMWIHEAWTTYLETLFVEFRYGRPDAIRYTNGFIPKVYNQRPILTERGVASDPPRDQYFKGALMIATLRSILDNDAEWFRLLRAFYDHFAYQNILTEDVVAWWSAQTHLDLTPIFDQYLRHTAIPCLELNFNPHDHTVSYKWQADEPAFAMPVRAGDPTHFQTLYPTTTWQTLPTGLTPEQFKVATELFYINVSKT